MTTENADYLSHILNIEDASRPDLHSHMAAVARERRPTTELEPPEERLEGLNDIVIRTFQGGRAPPSRPFQNAEIVENLASGRSGDAFAIDETIVVVAAGDRTDTPIDPFEFVIRLDTDPDETASGLTLDEVVRHCVSVEPIAAFVPATLALGSEPFLVLKTDLPSRNRLVSTQRRLNGTNVVMVPPVTSHPQSLAYKRYTNLTGTSLRPTKPQLRLSTMTLRLVRSDGTKIETTDPDMTMPRLVLRLRTRVPRATTY